eukprot:scaffold2645_cov378-Prasinococcus_capsulatus_cf.AAC.4
MPFTESIRAMCVWTLAWAPSWCAPRSTAFDLDWTCSIDDLENLDASRLLTKVPVASRNTVQANSCHKQQDIPARDGTSLAGTLYRPGA